MATGFQIASGFVAIHGEVDEDQIRRTAHRAGDRAGSHFTRAMGRRIGRDRNIFSRSLLAAFTPDAAIVTALRTGIPAVLGSPVGLAGLALGVVFAGSFVAGALGVLGVGLLGAGFAALAGFALREQLAGPFEEMAGRISKVVTEAAEPLVPSFLLAFDLIGAAFEEKVAGPLGAIFEGISTVVPDIAKGLGDMLGAFLEPLASPEALAGIREFFLVAMPEFERLAGALGEDLAILADRGPLFADALSEVVDIMITLSDLFFGLIIIGAAFLIAWDKWWAAVGRTVSRIGDWFTEDIPAFFGEAMAAARRSVAGILGFWSGLWRDLVSSARGVPGALVRAFAGLPAAFFNVGLGIPAGIARGILAALPSALDIARRMAGSLVDAARSFLGISSPSTLFADRVGRWIPEGVALGIRNAMPVVDRALVPALAGAGMVSPAAPPVHVNVTAPAVRMPAQQPVRVQVFIDGTELEPRMVRVIEARDGRVVDAIRAGVGAAR